MAFPDTIFKEHDAPPGMTVEIARLRADSQREEWVVGLKFELPNGIDTFDQEALPFDNVPASADQETVLEAAWDGMSDRVIQWVYDNEDAQPMEGQSFTYDPDQ